MDVITCLEMSRWSSLQEDNFGLIRFRTRFPSLRHRRRCSKEKELEQDGNIERPAKEDNAREEEEEIHATSSVEQTGGGELTYLHIMFLRPRHYASLPLRQQSPLHKVLVSQLHWPTPV